MLEPSSKATLLSKLVLELDGVLAKEAQQREQERQAFLLKFSDRIRPLANAEEITETACRLLVEHLDASRAQYTEVEGEAGAEIGATRGEFVRAGEPMPRRYPFAPYGESPVSVLRRGEVLVLTDTDADARLNEEQRALFQAVGSPAAVSAPFASSESTISAPVKRT